MEALVLLAAFALPLLAGIVALVLVIVGLATRRGALTAVGAIVLVLVCAFYAFQLLSFKLLPAATRVDLFAKLPPEAQIVRVNSNAKSWSNAGEVFFRLPETKTEAQWMQTIWEQNAPTKHDYPSLEKRESGPHHRSVRGGGRGTYELEYDPATKLWRYRMVLEGATFDR